jgi:hypothetical protein
MKRLILQLLLIGITSLAYGQGWEAPNQDDQRILALQNGDFLCYGASVARYSKEGHKVSGKTYSIEENTTLLIYDIVELPDGDFAFGGELIYLEDYEGSPDQGRTGVESALIYGQLNELGALVWHRSFFLGTEQKWDFVSSVIVEGDQLTFTGIYDSQFMFMVRTDLTFRDPIWTKTIREQNYREFDMDLHPDGGYAILTRSDFWPTEHLLLLRLDEEGEILTENTFGNSTDFLDPFPAILTITPDSRYLLVDETNVNGTRDIQILEVASDGTLSNTITFPSPGDENVADFISTADGGYVWTGASSGGPRGGRDVFMQKVTADFQPSWKQFYGSIINDQGLYVDQLQDQGYIISAWRGDYQYTFREGGDAIAGWLYRTDSLGIVYDNKAQGNVFQDLDLSCLNEQEAGQNAWLVAAESPLGTSYGLTDTAGNYCIPLDDGDYNLQLTLPSDYWEVCDNNIPVSFTGADTTDLDFATQVGIECPLMEVDISAVFLRRCFASTYYVSYCNKGTATGEDAYIEVDLDDFIHFDSASLPWTEVDDQKYRFDLGDVPAGACDDFKIEVTVDCDNTILGQTHCTEARIYPDSICTPSPDWSGASVEVDASCTGDSVVFMITNVGDAPTSGSLNYIVIVDQVVLLEGGFNLDPGQSKIVTTPANGATQRLEADQEPNHPGNDMPSVTVEGCGDDNGQISIGYVTQYSQNDGDPFVAIDCQENIGSFDPNDKHAQPKGYGPDHLIEANTELQYLIRFQNTGTDTAFTVIIRDPLSEHLDITSVRPGASSHPYRYSIEEGRILTFRFDNILLPDSTTNEPASHGFVKFKVRQTPDLPIGATIENKAGIYFDFNDPIITNTVSHMIGKDFIPTGTFEEPANALPARVFPNPFSETTTIEMPGVPQNAQLDLHIYDVNGRLLRRESHDRPRFDFQRQLLPKGLYIFRIFAGDTALHTGKLVIQ